MTELAMRNCPRCQSARLKGLAEGLFWYVVCKCDWNNELVARLFAPTEAEAIAAWHRKLPAEAKDD